MTKYCFCISAFNEVSSIKECIKSAMIACKNFDAQIFVVDNGSNDGTKEEIEKMKETYDFNFTRFEKNLTLQEARNFLLKNCNSEFAIFMDADGKVQNDYLHILDRKINKDFAIYSGPVLENRKTINLNYELHYKPLMLSDTNFLIGANFVVNKSLAIESGGFPNLTHNRGDETPLIIMMKKRGLKHLYIKELKTTNNFADNLSDFYRFAFQEGFNSYTLNLVYSLRNPLLYDLVRSIFILSILSLALGIFFASKIIVFFAISLFLIKIISRINYWKHVLINMLSVLSFKRFIYLLSILGFHLILDFGYWYAKLKRVKPNNKS